MHLSEPLNLFIVYDPQDEELKNELEEHLSALRREGYVKWYHSSSLQAGEVMTKTIRAHIDQAKLILLLISSDFMSNEVMYNQQVAYALERHQAGEASVVPVLLRDCMWRLGAFKMYSVLPKNGHAITSDHWATRDQAFTDVSYGIKAIVDEWAKPYSSSQHAYNMPAAGPGPMPMAMPVQAPIVMDSGDMVRSMELQSDLSAEVTSNASSNPISPVETEEQLLARKAQEVKLAQEIKRRGGWSENEEDEAAEKLLSEFLSALNTEDYATGLTGVKALFHSSKLDEKGEIKRNLARYSLRATYRSAKMGLFKDPVHITRKSERSYTSVCSEWREKGRSITYWVDKFHASPTPFELYFENGEKTAKLLKSGF